MTERYKPTLTEIQNQPDRDYLRPSDMAQAIERLVAGLKEDGDEYKMFELLGEALQVSPEVVVPVIQGSITVAAQTLGQDRRSGSSATLLYPVDAAVRVISKRLGLFAEDALSASNWNLEKLIAVLQNYPNEIITLAGSNTTSKNLPQRAAHILWLLDNCPLVQPAQKFSFLEIGASGGLILDALQQPKKFQRWMSQNGYRSDFAQKSNPSQLNAVLGIDLVKPELDWLQAVILEDELRDETTKFITDFARSPVAVESASEIDRSSQVRSFLTKNGSTLPIILSCFVFYQLDEETREKITAKSRSLLKQQGGGLLIISDVAKYRGYPEKAGGCVSWIENQDGDLVSPKILLSKSTLTNWEKI